MKFSDLPKHHAVLIVDDERDACGVALWNEIQNLSPAHRFFNQTVLDIDTVRKIIYWTNTPYNEEKVALISFHTIGIPAQNAMLKILEEPRDKVKFILLTSNKDSLINTIISRVCEVNRKEKDNVFDLRAKLFLETKPTLRIKIPVVIELLSNVDEEGRKDREGIKKFILQLVDILIKEKNIKSKYIQGAIEIADYASDPSASGKALLEYLSLLLPQLQN